MRSLPLSFLCILLTPFCTIAQERPLQAISGRLTEPNSMPLQASVRLYKLRSADGRLTNDPVCAVKTDDKGQFKCSDLPVGDYFAVASPSAQTPSSTAQIITAGLGGENDSPSFLHVHEDETVWARFDTPSRAGGAIALHGSFGNGQKGSSTRVYLRSAFFDVPLFDLSTEKKEDGTLTVAGLPAGSYRIAEEWPGKQRMVQAFSECVAEANRITACTRMERKTATLRGRVHADDQGGARVQTVGFELADSGVVDYRAESVQADGTFTTHSLPYGHYRILVFGGATPRISSLGYSNGSAPMRDLIVDERSDTQVADISVSHFANSFHGHLVPANEGCSEPGAVLVSDDASILETSSPASSGEFTFSGLPDGEYTLQGWCSITDVPYRESQLTKPFRDTFATIRLRHDAPTDDVNLLANQFHF